MNREKPIRDQAERLRKRVERKADNVAEKKELLPPRSEVHRQKQKKTKVKVKYPVIRLMALFFILLPVSFFSIITYLEGANGPLGDPAERAGIEMIDVESGSSGDDKKQVENEEDEEAPAIEENSESEQIDLAAGPAPDNADDKNDSTATESSNSDRKQAEDKDSAASQVEDGSGAGSEKIIYHTVQPSETLFRVAMKYYKSQEGIQIIRKANNLYGNEIQAGQVLKIPMKN